MILVMRFQVMGKKERRSLSVDLKLEALRLSIRG